MRKNATQHHTTRMTDGKPHTAISFVFFLPSRLVNQFVAKTCKVTRIDIVGTIREEL